MKPKPRNYQEYEDNLMDNCTFNKYGDLQTVGTFSIGNKVKIIVDWAPELKRNWARIVKFGKRGNKIWAEICWNDTRLFAKYGSLFGLDEIVKI